MNLVRPPTVIPVLVGVTRTPEGTRLQVGGEVDLLNSGVLREQLSAVRIDEGDADPPGPPRPDLL